MIKERPTDTVQPGNPPSPGRIRRQIDSDHLLQGGEQLEIVHRGEIYRLSITRQGKLILTK